MGFVPCRLGEPENGPNPSAISITPLRISEPASVTINDESLSRVISVPCNTPMMAQTNSAARIAPHQGHLVVAGSTSWTATTPPTPAV